MDRLKINNYKNGFKDRRERKFLGFGEIITYSLRNDNSVYRTNIQQYKLNELTESDAKRPSNYSGIRKYQYIAHLPTKSVVKDAIGRVISTTDIDYSFYNLTASNINSNFNTSTTQNINYGDSNRILALVKQNKTIVNHYQGNGSAYIAYPQTSVFNLYDKYGNVLQYKDLEENLVANITYHVPINNVYKPSIPKLHTVTKNGVVLRKTSTSIDGNNNISVIEKHLLDSTNAVAKTNLTYNSFGQLTEVKLPTDANGDRMSYNYSYDNRYLSFVTSIVDALGYENVSSYTNFGMPVLQKDIKGVEFTYDYDPTRRVIHFKGPYNNEWTIQNEYYVNSDGTYLAVTKHNLTDEIGGETNPKILHTSSFADGYGRIIQTKKQLDVQQICPSASDNSGYWFQVSGNVIYDEFGRVVQSFLAKEESNCSDNFLNQLKTLSQLNHSDIEKTIIQYDVLDRPIQQNVVGLNAVTSYEYGFDYDAFQVKRYFEKITLPEGNISLTFKDFKNRTTTTRQVNTDTGEILNTKFNYTDIGELEKVTDADSKVTSYLYDKLGRKIETNHPDNGTQKFEYDLTNKLIKSTNQNLLQNDEWINYKYVYNNLVQINYPSHQIKYHYNYNQLVKIEDLTGERMFNYGALGEVINDTRSLVVDGVEYSFKTKYRYDSWGRILEMEYPDQEKLLYIYNNVGQLKSLVNANNQIYLKDIKYTYFDQPYEILYGNNVTTTNSYDVTQRIRTMQLDRPDGLTFMQTKYSYDRNQNITRLENVASQHNLLRMGGTFDKVYTYDKFNRLATANGEFKGYNEVHNYNLVMGYNNTHGIVTKNQKHLTQTPDYTGPTVNNYVASYDYSNNDHPHAPSKIEYDNGNITNLSYDLNGNIIKIQSGNDLIVNGIRNFEWDEQNRLLSVNDNNGTIISKYTYDHAGERTVKKEIELSTANVGGELVEEIVEITDLTLYPVGHLVLSPDKNEYTKHYYINGKKIVSSINEGVNNFIQVARRTYNENSGGIVNSQNQEHCLSEIQILRNRYRGSQWRECLELINEIVANSASPCIAIQTINENVCNENGVSTPGIGKLPESDDNGTGTSPDSTTPNPQLQSQFDCLARIISIGNQIESDLLNYNLPNQRNLCNSFLIKQIQDYIRMYNNYQGTLPDNLLPCNMLNLIIASDPYNCIEKPDEGYLDEIQPPVYVEENPFPHPIPEGSNEPGEEEEYDESQRSAIWWYHSDHLGSSSYLTDNFGRPTHYYDQLPFGEIGDSPNTKTK